MAGCPNGGSIGAHDRRTHCTESAVHVGVRIGGDHKRARHHVPACHHDLVANAGTGGIKIHPVLLGECLNRAVLLLIRLILILNIMVERKHKLRGIMNLLRADLLELAHDRRRVVVCHDIARMNGDEVSRSQRPLRPFRSVRLRDLFDNGLTHRFVPTVSLACTGPACLRLLLPSPILVSSPPSPVSHPPSSAPSTWKPIRPFPSSRSHRSASSAPQSTARHPPLRQTFLLPQHRSAGCEGRL